MNIIKPVCINLLLISFLLSVLSCKQNKKTLSEKEERMETKDSITISLLLPPKTSFFLNFGDRPELHGEPIEFKNTSTEDSLIVKKLSKKLQHEVFSYLEIKKEKGKWKFFCKYFLTLDDSVNLKLKDLQGDMNIVESTNLLDIDRLFQPYEDLRRKILKEGKLKISQELAKKKLDSIYETNKIKNNSEYQELLNEINYINYLDDLQYINPNDPHIKNYLSKKHPLLYGRVGPLLYKYTANTIDSLNFENLEISSKSYLKNLAKGLFLFLKFEDNKGRAEFEEARKWLKTTDFYKNDSTYIKDKITSLDKELFKSKIEKLKLETLDGKVILFPEIIRTYPNDFYLIDFWATWCSPCIKGIKSIKKMKIPQNVFIINLSVDKSAEREKWTQTTKQLGIKISYLLEENDGNKDFLKFIELQSIPRYVLIDKKMNIIFQAFYHPEEVQFLKKLNDIERFN